MRYSVELKPRAQKDLRKLEKQVSLRLINALEMLQEDLFGDVKRLTNFSPEYRLRVGQYRILFELEDENRVVVYRIRHRRDVYRK